MPAEPSRLGQLRQIQVRFDPENDRLLLRVNTSEKAELRCWLTRRLVKRIWPAVVRSLGNDPQVATQASPQAREAVLHFRREQALAGSDFARPFEEQGAHTPLGDEPILASRVRLRPTPRGHVLSLHPKQGQGLNLTLEGGSLHALCELIQRAARAADWDLELEVVREPRAEATPSGPIN